MSGLGSAVAVATAFVGSAEGEGVGEVALCLFGSTTQPDTRNTDKIRISTDRFISLTPLTLVRSNERSSLLLGFYGWW
jgi:hypothetical protein